MSRGPPGTWRTIRLITGLAFSRQKNLFFHVLTRGWKKKREGRSGTPRKGRGNPVVAGVLSLLLAFQGFFLASQAVGRLCSRETVAATKGDVIEVRPSAKIQIGQYADALKKAREQPGGPNRDAERGWRRELNSAFWRAALRETGAQEAAEARRQAMWKVFELRGVDGFVATAGPSMADPAQWPGPEDEPRTLRALGLLLIMVFAAAVMSALGLGNKEIGRAEWSFEWLYGFPVPASALLLSKLVVHGWMAPLTWFGIFPLLSCMYYAAGWGWGCVPLAAGFTLLLGLVAGGAVLLVEFLMRRHLGLDQVRNIQALFAVTAALGLVAVVLAGSSQPVANGLNELAGRAPGWVLFNPIALPVLLCGHPARGGAGVAWIGSGAALSCVALASAALAGTGRLIAGGLVQSAGPGSGRRGRRFAFASGVWIQGIVKKEMLLLCRDRTLLLQTLLSPLLMMVFYLFANANVISAARADFHHGAALAYGLGAYMLVSSALMVLWHERTALWHLYTLPHSLAGILARKTAVWCALAMAYTGGALAVIWCFSPSPGIGAIGCATMALAGVGIFAFIAAAMGALATDPFADASAGGRIGVGTVYLFMLLATMYAHAIYTPSIWAKVGQVVLSGCLAFALWQKVRDAMPYLLDPEMRPPAALSVADGMIAALAFFTLQGVSALMLVQRHVPLDRTILLAFFIAGAVTVPACLVILWRRNMPRLLEELGVRRPPGGTRVTLEAALGTGLCGGVCAAVAAGLYLWILGAIPALRQWREMGRVVELSFGNGGGPWPILVFVVAAPLFEEFIFRGLLFQGMRRSAGRWPAILGSAAVFALVHPPISVVPVFGLGVAAALCLDRTRWLLAPVVAHMAYNALVMGLQHMTG